MGKIAAYLLVGIGVGLGFAWWQGTDRTETGPGSGVELADRSPLERRLSELETSLALERYERQALADELDALRAELQGFPVTVGDSVGEEAGDRLANRRDADGLREEVEGRIRQRFPDGLPQDRNQIEAMLRERQLSSYVEAGFTPDRAEWIMQREDELELEALEARYLATQNGASAEDVANLTPSNLLRAELGDSEYEQYLAGRGRPTTINVREVLPSSQAESAGLQAGDEIVAYNGKRVFDMSELNDLTYEAGPGQTVPLEVLRDGQRIQVYVAGGPIGVSGGGRSSRRDFGGGR